MVNFEIPESEKLFYAFSNSTVRDTNSKNDKINLNDLIIKIQNPPKHLIPLYEKIKDTTIQGLNRGLSKSDISSSISNLKLKLPFVMLGGYQPVGHNNRDIEWNGGIQVDIDFKEAGGQVKAIEMKKLLSELPYIVLVGFSPSGVGVKALVHTTATNKQNFKSVEKQVFDRIKKDLNKSDLHIDSLSVSQATYLPYDRDLHINLCAELVEVEDKTIEPVTPPANIKFEEVSIDDTTVKIALERSYNSSARKNGGVFDTIFIQSYVGAAKGFGVDSNTALNYLYEKGHSAELSNKRLRSFHNMYNKMAGNSMNIKKRVTRDVKHVTPTPQPVRALEEYKLTPDQTVTDLNLNFDRNFILHSPTGSGKSYAIRSVEGNKIIVVPNTTVLKNFCADGNITPFYEDEKHVSEFVCTTYKSLKNLVAHINPEDYTLFFDEFHNVASSSSTSYLGNALNEVVELLPEFKNYVGLTATPLCILHPELFKLPTVKVVRKSKSTKTYNEMHYSKDLIAEVRNQVDSKPNNLHIVLINNKKEDGKLGDFKATFADKSVVTINADVKDTDDYVELVREGTVNDKTDVIFTTTVMKEGNSIINHNKNITLHIIGNFSPSDIEQTSARFRKAESITTINYKKDKDRAIMYFDYESRKKEIIENAKGGLEAAKIIRKANDLKTTIRAMNGLNGFHLRINKEGEVEIDWLAVQNDLYVQQTVFFNNSFENMSNELVKYGWVKGEVLTSDSELDDNTKEVIVEHRENEKFNKALKIDSILSDIVANPPELNEAKKKVTKDRMEQDVRHKVIELMNYVETTEEAVNMLKKIGFTTAAWSRYKRALTYRKVYMSDTDADVKKTIVEVYKHFKVGESYTRADINKFFNELVLKYNPNRTYMNHHKTTKLLKDFFNIKSTSTRDGDVVSSVVNIISDNPLPFELKQEEYNTLSISAMKQKQLELNF